MTWDLFVSHRWSDKPWVNALVVALSARQVTCFVDAAEIEPVDAITPRIRRAMAESRALLACYSADYSASRACQWELTAAYLAGEAAAPSETRVVVVNPEVSAGHIEIGDLADRLAVPVVRSERPADHAEAAEAVARAVRRLNGPMGDLAVQRPPAWFGGRIPLGSRRFVGRLPHLWSIHGRLRASLDSVTRPAAAGRSDAVLLHGMGGSGKTLLAEEYAIRFGAAYPGGVVWLNGLAHDDRGRPEGFDHAALQRQLLAVAGSLGVPADDHPEIDELRRRLFWHLGEAGRVLWIVDDLPGGLHREELDRWLAPAPIGANLVTTRTSRYAGLLDPLVVDALDERDGVQLLAARPELSGAFDADAARRIVAAVGGHALALDVSGAYLTRTTSPTMAAFAADLEAPDSTLASGLGIDLGEELPSGHEASIALTFVRSISQLGDDAFLALTLAAHLGPMPLTIPVDLLVHSAELQLDEPGIHGRIATACEDAISRSLLRAGAPSSNAVTMHRLVSHVMRAEAAEVWPDARLVLIDAIRDFLEPADEVYDTASLTGLGPYVAQADHLIGDGPHDEIEADVASYMSRFELAQGAYRAALAHAQRVADALTGLVGIDHPRTIIARNTVGSCLLAAGRQTEALDIFEELAQTIGDSTDDDDTLKIRANLASTLLEMGRSERASSLVEGLRRDLEAGRIADEGAMFVESILALWHGVRDELPQAMLLRERAVERAQAVFGPHDRRTLIMLNNLGLLLSKMNRSDRAEQVLREVVSGRELILGPTHPETLNSANNLATVLWGLGRHEEAASLLVTVLEARTTVLGADHPLTLQSGNNLAATLPPARAVPVLREVVAGYDRVLKIDNLHSLIAKRSLASGLYTIGELEEARELATHVLDGFLELLGPDHQEARDIADFLTTVNRDISIRAAARTWEGPADG